MATGPIGSPSTEYLIEARALGIFVIAAGVMREPDGQAD
jgi:hypothetical protein